MTRFAHGTNPITTALLLAAGTGVRLQPLTDDAPKCLTEVNGITILQRLIDGLCETGFKRLVVVVGYLDGCIREFLSNLDCDLTIEFVSVSKYRTTNNIYSLWTARRAIEPPFLLVECDLVFDAAMLEPMRTPDRIAVSHILPWMNGTTVCINSARQVQRFQLGGCCRPDEAEYKTVNMYSFSPPSWRRVAARLEQHISAGRVNAYYETVFAEMVADGSLSLEAVPFDDQCWYEIDTLGDLYEAERLFPGNSRRSVSGVS